MRLASPIPSALSARGIIGESARGRDASIVACPGTSRGNVPSSGQRHRELQRCPLQPGYSRSRRLMQMPAHQLLQVKARQLLMDRERAYGIVHVGAVRPGAYDPRDSRAEIFVTVVR
ncbi:hypothetical protein CsatB_023110 [Cannabis sativa]